MDNSASIMDNCYKKPIMQRAEKPTPGWEPSVVVL
jgi:hypothetical protein